MIQLIGRKDFPAYKEGAINFAITSLDGMDVQKINLLTPTSGLKEAWRRSDGSDESWEAFKAGYLEELSSVKGQAGIELLNFYSKMGKTVNVICSCSNPYRCARSLIYSTLLAKGVEVFMEGANLENNDGS